MGNDFWMLESTTYIRMREVWVDGKIDFIFFFLQKSLLSWENISNVCVGEFFLLFVVGCMLIKHFKGEVAWRHKHIQNITVQNMIWLECDACASNVIQESVNERNDAPYLYVVALCLSDRTPKIQPTDPRRYIISFFLHLTHIYAGLLVN